MPATQGHSPNMTWCDQLFLTFDVHLLPQVYHCHAPKKTQTRVTFTELIGKLKEKIAEICVAKSVHQCFIIQKSYLFTVSDYPARTPSILIVDQVTSHLGDGLEKVSVGPEYSDYLWRVVDTDIYLWFGIKNRSHITHRPEQTRNCFTNALIILNLYKFYTLAPA